MDYTLVKGDTFRPSWGTNIIEYEVQVADTVQVNGVDSKHLVLMPLDYSAGNHNVLSLLEGIGGLNIHPLSVYTELTSGYPTWNGVPELSCFKNNGIIPSNPFVSDSTCKRKSLSINDGRAVALQQPGIYPQPAKDRVSIRLPQVFEKGMLYVFNIAGQCIYKLELLDNRMVTIDNPLGAGGICFYKITGEGLIYSGKLFFE